MSTWEIYERKTSNDDMPFSLSIEERDDIGLFIWPNWHKEIEIMYMTEGSAKVVLEQQEYHLEKGDIIIVNADELHSAYSETAPCSCKVITLDPKYIIKNTLYQALLLKPLLIKDETAITYIERIFEEFLEQSYGYMDTSKAYLTLLIVYLYRTYSQKSASDSTVQKHRHSAATLYYHLAVGKSEGIDSVHKPYNYGNRKNCRFSGLQPIRQTIFETSRLYAA